MNNEQLIKDYEKLIINLSDENKKLKAQLYSKDQVFTTCPNCGEEFLINQCRVVSDLQGQIEIMEKYFEHLINLANDVRTWDSYSKEDLIDDVNFYANLGKVANTTEVMWRENGKQYNILKEEINDENSNKTN